jgi:hypothetical protein
MEQYYRIKYIFAPSVNVLIRMIIGKAMKHGYSKVVKIGAVFYDFEAL